MPDSRITDEQSRRTIREDLGTNLLVEAGAGSGKTQMLAERMAAGIATGAYQIEHLAAVELLRGRYKNPRVSGAEYYFSSHKGKKERKKIKAPGVKPRASSIEVLIRTPGNR